MLCGVAAADNRPHGFSCGRGCATPASAAAASGVNIVIGNWHCSQRLVSTISRGYTVHLVALLAFRVDVGVVVDEAETSPVVTDMAMSASGGTEGTSVTRWRSTTMRHVHPDFVRATRALPDSSLVRLPSICTALW